MMSNVSAAGTQLGFLPNETEEQRRRRLAAVQTSQQAIGRSLGSNAAVSPAARYLGLGGISAGM